MGKDFTVKTPEYGIKNRKGDDKMGYELLSKINGPEDVKKLYIVGLKGLAEEIREALENAKAQFL